MEICLVLGFRIGDTDENYEDFFCSPRGPIRKINLGRNFPGFLRKEITRFHELRKKYRPKPYPWPPRILCRCAPLYEPDWWNDGGQIQFNNNCYNYGSNYRTDTYAQPGRAAGAMYTSLSCASVKPAPVLMPLSIRLGQIISVQKKDIWLR